MWEEMRYDGGSKFGLVRAYVAKIFFNKRTANVVAIRIANILTVAGCFKLRVR
jgi:hypothetical protein